MAAHTALLPSKRKRNYLADLTVSPKWLARGLKNCVVGGIARDLANNKFFNNTLASPYAFDGQAAWDTTDATPAKYISVDTTITGGELSIIAMIWPTSAPAFETLYAVTLGPEAPGSLGASIYWGSFNGSGYGDFGFEFYDGLATKVVSIGSGTLILLPNQPHCVGCRADSSTARIWLNGRYYSTTSTSGAPYPTGASTPELVIGRGDVGGCKTAVSLVLTFDSALTPDEMASLTENPWQVFTRPVRRVHVPTLDSVLTTPYIVTSKKHVQKPLTHEARIDFSHPLTLGLKLCFLLDEPKAGPRELISGIKASGANGDFGSTIRYQENSAAYGPGIFVDHSYVTWQPGAGFPLDFSAAFSAAWGGTYLARSTSNAFFCGVFDSARTSSVGVQVISGGFLQLKLGSGGVIFTGSNSDTIYDSKRVDSCVAWSAVSTNAKWYIDGTERFSDTSSTTPANFGANPYFTIGTSIDLNANEAFDGNHAYFYVYDRKLSALEAMQLAANPWQIFRPIRRRLYSFASVAVDGDFLYSNPLIFGAAL